MKQYYTKFKCNEDAPPKRGSQTHSNFSAINQLRHVLSARDVFD